LSQSHANLVNTLTQAKNGESYQNLTKSHSKLNLEAIKVPNSLKLKKRRKSTYLNLNKLSDGTLLNNPVMSTSRLQSPTGLSSTNAQQFSTSHKNLQFPNFYSMSTDPSNQNSKFNTASNFYTPRLATAATNKNMGYATHRTAAMNTYSS
jgi:hypothetical protein